MAIRVQCALCAEPFQVPDDQAGKTVACPKCGCDVPAVDYSASGSPIYRHAPRTKEFTLTTGDGAAIEAISSHIETHLGAIDGVFHELLSDLVHIDVHHVAPADERPFHTLITSGMSDLPMTVPEGAEAFRFAELLIHLPPEWPLTQEAFQDEANYWPVRWLKTLARLPHEYNTWLGYGHTVPNGDPPQPFARNTELCCCLIFPPLEVPDEFGTLEVDADKQIHFYGLTPLYREEMDFKLAHGMDALIERFEEHDISGVLDLQRRNVCKDE